MQYSELAALGMDERRKALENVSSAELANLIDERPYEMAGFTPRDDRQYFDDIESLHAYLLKYYVPESKPWEADEAASHELAHARCALTLKVSGVKYYALSELDTTTQTSIFTQPFGPITLPNLAWAAISAHPYTADRSIADMRNIRSYGYRSREHVAERIALWNSRNNGLYIPTPETSPTPYPPTD